MIEIINFKNNKDYFKYRIIKGEERNNNGNTPFISINNECVEYYAYIEFVDFSLYFHEHDNYILISHNKIIKLYYDDFMDCDSHNNEINGFYLNKEQYKPFIKMLNKIGLKLQDD